LAAIMQVTRQRSARGPRDPGLTGVKTAAPRRRCAREETWDDLPAGADDDAALPELSPNDAINIQYTSGTRPQGRDPQPSHPGSFSVR
jgi:acyl-coenzyme A synthetase/AMP-(fatty) acid ligase